MAKSLAATIAAPGTEVLDLETPDFGGLSVAATRVNVPYVVFAQPKATEQWTSLVTKLPGIQDGDQVLVYPDPDPPVRLQPMRFTMISCKQFWVKKDAQGQSQGKPSLTPMPRAEGWKEEVFAACIVYVQRGGDLEAVPASCVFKTVKCGAALGLKLQIDAAEKVEWAEQSPAHKMAFAAFKSAYLRVVAAVAVGKRTAGSGFGYVPARSIVAPATPAEYGALQKLMANGGKEKIAKLSEHYKLRLTEMGVS